MDALNQENKLRTFCLFKKEFKCENYVQMISKPLSSTYCKLRISAHKLYIERGRYTKPKTPIEKRLCLFCNLNEVEDEFHFLMKCDLYSQLRSPFLDKLRLFLDIDKLNDRELFFFLLQSQEHDVIKDLTHFVSKSFEKREDQIASWCTQLFNNVLVN